MTLDAVIGNNDKEIRKKIVANAKASSSTLSLKKKCKAWCDFMDDLVFLKHLDKVVFMNVTEDTKFIENILPDMVNKNVYNTTQDNYFVGFPVQTNTNDNRSVTQDTPFYDENTVGTVRFLDEKWVEEFFSKDYIDSMKSNLGRKMSIPESTKYMIITEMIELRKLHCTHVYKYHCEKL